jgi:hypothetical protein
MASTPRKDSVAPPARPLSGAHGPHANGRRRPIRSRPRPAPCQARMVRTLRVNPDAPPARPLSGAHGPHANGRRRPIRSRPRPAPCQARMARTLTNVGGRFGRRETPISGRGPPFHAQLAGSEPCRTWWIDSAVHLACPPCAGERNAVEIRSGGPRQRRSGESGLGARAARGKDARASRAWALARVGPGRSRAWALGRVGPGRSGPDGPPATSWPNRCPWPWSASASLAVSPSCPSGRSSQADRRSSRSWVKPSPARASGIVEWSAA